MAIYHLTVRNVSRAGRQSVLAKAQYITRQGKYARQQDKVVHTESGNMPAWARERPLEYWRAADRFERTNGRLGKEVEFALPVELAPRERTELARDFVRDLTRKEQFPFTLAVHEGRGTNPHAHLIISERANDGIDRTREAWFRRAHPTTPELGGARKSASLRARAWLARTREVWAEKANEALQEAGVYARIDHRSLNAQGIDRVPQQHIGVRALAMEERGVRTERGDRHLQILKANERTENLERERGWDRERDRSKDRSAGLELG